MGKNEITNWDAEISLVSVNTGQIFFDNWYAPLTRLSYDGIISKGDIRTFDQVDELLKQNDNKDTVLIFTKDNDSFPQAREILGQKTNIGRYVFSALGSKSVSDDDADQMGLAILNKSFTISADGKTLTTRNTFPEAVDGKNREDQTEDKTCSIYEEKTKIGQETRPNGILHESNQARFALIFAITDKKFQTDDFSTLHAMPVTDVNGKQTTLYWRWIDLSSQPSTKANFIAPDEIAIPGKGWGSIVLPPCGVYIKPTEMATVFPKSQSNQPSVPGQPESSPALAPTNIDNFTPLPQVQPTPGATPTPIPVG